MFGTSNKCRFFLLFTIVAFLYACTSPIDPKLAQSLQGKSTLTITVAGSGVNGSKTIVPDLVSSVTSYSVTLTSKDSPAFATRTADFLTNELITFQDIETGLWDIKLEAKKSDGIILASALQENYALAVDTTTVNLSLEPVLSGKGSLALNVQFDSLDVDSVTCILKNSANEEVNPITVSPITPLSASIKVITISANDLEKGAYTLSMNFKQGGESLGVFTESINIFSGLVSDKWIDSTGTLISKRIYASTDFATANVKLSMLTLDGLNTTQFAFNSGAGIEDTVFTLNDYPLSALTFTAVESVLGQSIAYSWNDTSYGLIKSESKSNPLLLKAGFNTLKISVTAPSRGLTKNYIININQTPFNTGLSTAKMQMAFVPKGTFQRDAIPTNTSYVSSFYMGKYEVTRAQYLQVMGYDTSDISKSPTANCPVQNITWFDAVSFCNKLSELEGFEKVYRLTNVVLTQSNMPGISNITNASVSTDFSKNGYRLPTEMEWLWAGMSAPVDGQNGNVNTSAYLKDFVASTGSNNASDYAWFGTSVTAPVGTKLPNELGLYDMNGNVWEFCNDRGANAFVTPSGALENYTGSVENASYCAARGGSYYDPIANLKFTLTMHAHATFSPFYGAGFRVARNAEERYTISYNANNATNGTLPAELKTYEKGASVIVEKNIGNLTKTDCTFAGWTTSLNSPGASYGLVDTMANIILIDKNITLYAVWIPNNLTFETTQTEIIINGEDTNNKISGSFEFPQGITRITYAFVDNLAITELSFPSSITSYNSGPPNYLSGMFVRFSNLKKASFAPGSTLVGYNQFSGCSNLAIVQLPDSITEVGTSAFFETGLSSIILPSKLCIIGTSAFQGSKLKSVFIPKSVSSLDVSAFLSCSELVSITVASDNPYYSSVNGVLYNKAKTDLKKVPENYNAENKKFTIPETVTSVSMRAFFNCKNIEELEIPASCSEILTYCFEDAKIKKVSIALDNPSYVTSAECNAIYNKNFTKLYFIMPNAESITIPNTVTEIVNAAAYKCRLTSVTIPENVTIIGSFAFNCSNYLATVNMKSVMPPTITSNVFSYDYNYSDVLQKITVPDETSVTAYKAAVGWSDYSAKIFLYVPE